MYKTIAVFMAFAACLLIGTQFDLGFRFWSYSKKAPESITPPIHEPVVMQSVESASAVADDALLAVNSFASATSGILHGGEDQKSHEKSIEDVPPIPATVTNALRGITGQITVRVEVPVRSAKQGTDKSESTDNEAKSTTKQGNRFRDILTVRDKQWTTAIEERRADKALINELQAVTKLALATPASRTLARSNMAVLARCRTDELMDQPKVDVVNQHVFEGGIVYYVNGMATSHESALTEAKALSEHLKRPVGLIYCHTDYTKEEGVKGLMLDLIGAAYDRAWPFHPPVTNRPQANEATRQVAHLLHHSDAPISIVSHSRGSLIVRNALMIADLFSSVRISERTAWIATGMPLNDEEVYAKPRRFRAVRNPGDPISQSVGLQLEPNEFLKQNLGHHAFVKCYVSKLRLNDLSF